VTIIIERIFICVPSLSPMHPCFVCITSVTSSSALHCCMLSFVHSSSVVVPPISYNPLSLVVPFFQQIYSLQLCLGLVVSREHRRRCSRVERSSPSLLSLSSCRHSRVVIVVVRELRGRLLLCRRCRCRRVVTVVSSSSLFVS
jgi:hypothetical protein